MSARKRRPHAATIALAALTLAVTGRVARADEATDGAARLRASRGLELGVRAGAMVPMGTLAGTLSLSDEVSTAPFLWFDLGYRTPQWFIGGAVQWAKLSLPSAEVAGGYRSSVPSNALTCGSADVSCGGHDLKVLAEGIYYTSPEADFDPWIGLGVGGDSMGAGATVPPGNAAGAQNISTTWTGPTFAMFQVGANLRFESAGLGVFGAFDFGQFGSFSGTVGTTSSSGSIPTTALHEWFSVGLRGYFDISTTRSADAQPSSDSNDSSGGGGTNESSDSVVPTREAPSRTEVDDRRREAEDAKLLDQLRALCDDGNTGACRALDFATKKRGCCTWHRGARKCNDDGLVVCMDGEVSTTCSCAVTSDAASSEGATAPAPPAAPKGSGAARGPARPTPPAAKKNCNPNYTVDANGGKHPKPECFAGGT